jgi:hypothetical protein
MQFEPGRTGRGPLNAAGSEAAPVDPVTAFWNAHDESLHGIRTVAKVLDCSPAKIERDIWSGQGIGALFMKIDGMRRARKGDLVAHMRKQRDVIPT